MGKNDFPLGVERKKVRWASRCFARPAHAWVWMRSTRFTSGFVLLCFPRARVPSALSQDGEWYEFEGENPDVKAQGLWVCRWISAKGKTPGNWQFATNTRVDKNFSYGDLQRPTISAKELPFIISKYDYTCYEPGRSPPYRYAMNPDWRKGTVDGLGTNHDKTPANAAEEEQRILQRHPGLKSVEQAMALCQQAGGSASDVQAAGLEARNKLLKAGRTPRNGDELMHAHLAPNAENGAEKGHFIRLQFCGINHDALESKNGKVETKRLVGQQQLRGYRMQSIVLTTPSPPKGLPFPGGRVADCNLIMINLPPGSEPSLFGLEPIIVQAPRSQVQVQVLRGGVIAEALTPTDHSKRKADDVAQMSRWGKADSASADASRKAKFCAREKNDAAMRQGKQPVHSEEDIERLGQQAREAKIAAHAQAADTPPETLGNIATRVVVPPKDFKVPGHSLIADDASDPSMTVPVGDGSFVQGGEYDRKARQVKAIEVPAKEAAIWPLLREQDLRYIPGRALLDMPATGPNGSFKEGELDWSRIKMVAFATVPSLASEGGIDHPFLSENATGRDLDLLNRPQAVATLSSEATNPYSTPPVMRAHNFDNRKTGINSQDEAKEKRKGVDQKSGEIKGLNLQGNKLIGKGLAEEVDKLGKEFERWNVEVKQPYEERRQASLESHFQAMLQWKERDDQWRLQEQERLATLNQARLAEMELWAGAVGDLAGAEDVQEEEEPKARPNPEPMPEPDFVGAEPAPPSMVIEPNADGGQNLVMMSGPTATTKDPWPAVDMELLFKDKTFAAVWNIMTDVPPPSQARVNDGVARPPSYIDACGSERNGKHKNAYVISYAIYDRSAFEEAWARSNELKKQTELQALLQKTAAEKLAIRQKAQSAKATRVAATKARQVAAANEEACLAAAAAQRDADERERAMVLDADRAKIKAFHDKHLPNDMFPKIAGRAHGSSRDLTDAVRWRNWADCLSEERPAPHPTDGSALNGLNQQDGMRYEEIDEFTLREAEYWAAKAAGRPHVPYTPTRHEAAFSVYAMRVGADAELQQMTGLRIPLYAEASSSAQPAGSFAPRLAGDRNGPRFGEKPGETRNTLGMRSNTALISGYLDTNHSDFGKRVRTWDNAERVAVAARRAAELGMAANLAAVLGMQPNALEARLAARKQEMLKNLAALKASAAAVPSSRSPARSPARMEDGRGFRPPLPVRQRSHHEEETAETNQSDGDDAEAHFSSASDDDEPAAQPMDGAAGSLAPYRRNFETLFRSLVGGTSQGPQSDEEIWRALADRPEEELKARAEAFGEEGAEEAVLTARARGLALKEKAP